MQLNKLQKINLPNSLTKISDNAFEKCKISNDIVFGENLGHVGHANIPFQFGTEDPSGVLPNRFVPVT